MRANSPWLGFACLAIGPLAGCNVTIPADVWNSESAHAIVERQRAEADAATGKENDDNLKQDDDAIAPHPDDRVAGANARKLPAAYRPYTTWSLDETAAAALVRLGPASLPELEIELADGDTDQRRRAAATIARIGPDAAARVETLELLVNTLADKQQDPLVRRACARALGQIGPAIWPRAPQPYQPSTALAALPATSFIPAPRADGTNAPREIEQSLRVDYYDHTSARYQEYEAAVRDYNQRRAIAQRAVELLAEIAAQGLYVLQSP